MKKTIILKSMLVLFPVLAVGLATTMDSVMVFDTISGTTSYFSYFDPVPVENIQMLPPLAATLCVISGILAAVYLGKNKMGCLKAAGYVAGAAAVAAAIPVTIRGDVLVVPNVALPIFMLAQYAVAYYVGKMPQKALNKKKAPRLKNR